MPFQNINHWFQIYNVKNQNNRLFSSCIKHVHVCINFRSLQKTWQLGIIINIICKQLHINNFNATFRLLIQENYNQYGYIFCFKKNTIPLQPCVSTSMCSNLILLKYYVCSNQGVWDSTCI